MKVRDNVNKARPNERAATINFDIIKNGVA